MDKLNAKIYEPAMMTTDQSGCGQGYVSVYYYPRNEFNDCMNYLDGPHPLDPIGKINNVSFQCVERTPISADILYLESTLLPGTTILVDGRVNNVRFLKNNSLQTRSYILYTH